jgi:HemY protein
MTRLIVTFVAVALIAAGVAWLVDRPGEVVLTWQGYRIETSLVAAGILVLAAIVVAMTGWTGLRLILGIPGALSGFLRNRRRAKGYQALSRGMIAVGSGDARLAARYAEQARSIMGEEPLTLLLRAQTAQLSGDRATARKSFQAMLASPETETLGLRGLFIEAERNGDVAAMRGFAERALRLDAATAWAARALFEMQCAGRDWKGALATLHANQSNGIIDRAPARRLRAVLLTAQAMEMEERDPEDALSLALEAHRLAPDLAPAASLAGRLLTDADNPRRAVKVLEKSWKLVSHPDIAEAYLNVRPGDSTRDRLKRMRTLAAMAKETREGAIALAGAAIDAHEWGEARAALKPYLDAGLTQRICTLMAEIEEGEHGDAGRGRAWLSRAVRAPRDPAWTADGVVSEAWAPVSPVTGRLDAFEWRVPFEALAPPSPDLFGEPEADVDTLVLPMHVAGPTEKAAGAGAPGSKPAAQGDKEKKTDKGDKAEADAGEEGRKEAPPQDLFATHAPDDPGPDGDMVKDEDAELQRGG